VIALVPDEWGPQWHTRHHLLSRLAGYFPVVWVNYPPGWRHLISILWRRCFTLVEYPSCPGLQVYQSKFWLPRLGRPAWVARLISRRRLRGAGDLLRAKGCTKIVLYVWRPEFADAIELMAHDLSIYHVDDEYSFSSTEVGTSPEERSLLESAGQVFIHSVAMMAKKGLINPNTEFVPNGVDYSLYATPVPEPDDLRPIPHPRIGYVGILKKMLDWTLLLELSVSHPKWSFVFVGPKAGHPEIDAVLKQMEGRPNVYFLGGKPTERLGAYPQHFDVCIMPYRPDGYTKYIYPLKMHEYLASGMPAVSSPIRSVQEFGNVVALAGSPDQWSQAIEDALSADQTSPSRRALRQKVAREYAWDKIVDKVAHTIARRLGIPMPDSSNSELVVERNNAG
jgi:glycosyltransferase involved in cell wall biosynthesis